ncbi:hypothetical protein [Maribacter sp.]|uniref:hypothetical protein n=1 Tax=Maribacter sp. TaxID=1897614 RepID=UPI0032997FDB
MTKTTPKFNSSLTFLIAIINTTLFFTFFKGFGNGGDHLIYLFIICCILITVQLGLIAYFDNSENKKIYKNLAIIALVISGLIRLILLYLTGLAAAFQH